MFKKKIKSLETVICSDWTIESNKLTQQDAFEVSERIYNLTQNYLEKVFDAGWEILFRDPVDGRLWELTFPKGDMHGGGPRRLSYISNEEANKKYKIAF